MTATEIHRDLGNTFSECVTRYGVRPAVRKIAQYDAAFQSGSRVLADGTQVQWHVDKGAVETRVTLPGEERVGGDPFSDGKQETWRVPEGCTYQSRLRYSRPMTCLPSRRPSARAATVA